MRKLVLGALLALTSCAVTPGSLSVAVMGNHRIGFMGEKVRLDQIQTIILALEKLPPEMLESEPVFHIRNDWDHFGKTWNGLQSDAHASCTEACYPKICLLPSAIGPACVWHETAHAYEAYLDNRGSAFTKEWKKVAGNVYTKTSAVGEGIIDSYCRINHLEDVARWVEYCYLFTRNYTNHFYKVPDLKVDPRYRLKLDLLLKYKFLNDEDYKKLKLLLE